jgi:hypothetical protein
MCHLVQTIAQTGWTSATLNAVTFGSGSEVIDTDGMHDTGSNTSRIVIGNRLGWWEISGVYVPVNQNANTNLRAVLRKNGSDINGSFSGLYVSSPGTAFVGVTTPRVLVQATSVTDYVELMGYQTAASGTIGTAVNTYVTSSLTAVWRGSS